MSRSARTAEPSTEWTASPDADGQPGARTWWRILTVEGAKTDAGIEVIERGLAALAEAAERRAEAVAA